MQRPRREESESAPRTRLTPRAHALSVIVLTSDPALLATVQEAAGAGHRVLEAASISAAVELLLGGHCGIFLIDIALVGSELARFTEKLQAQFPEVVLLATGQRKQQQAVAALVANGRIYRFLHKPVSPARAELFLSAATRRCAELRQSELQTNAARDSATSRQRLLAAGAALCALLGAGAWLSWPNEPVEPRLAPRAAAPLLSESTQLRGMLAQADAAYRAGNAVPPAANNAFETYRAVLALDPGNPGALAGKQRIIASTRQRVTKALAAKDAARATIELKTLRLIAPADSQLEVFQEQLNALAPSRHTLAPSAPAPTPTRRANPTANANAGANPAASRREASAPVIVRNVDLARASLAADQLVEPSGTSALDQLRRARAAGEDPTAIQIAATDLGTRLLDRSLAAAKASDLENAQGALAAATRVDREFETTLPDLDVIAARIRELAAASQGGGPFNDRLTRASALRSNGKLLEPADDNAYVIMKQLLAEGASSPELHNEQQRLAFALLESTRTALAAGDVDGADVLATRTEEIVPGLAQTKALREQIGAGRAARDDRNAVLQAASVPRRRQVPAVYPRDALLKRIEGWVDLEFVIGADGTPSQIAVKTSEPSRVFDTPAAQALRQWRFEPIVRDGAAQAHRATLRMEFKLEK